jgi:ubiquinone biosynthesis protein
MQQVEGGRIEVHLEHKRLESAANRLVFGMWISAMFLGSSMMLSAKVWPAPWDISIPGALGLGISLLLAVRLFWAIQKSGKLDQE